ncbi:MAG TPA: ABC transporter permease [Planctomycetota bacterium]
MNEPAPQSSDKQVAEAVRPTAPAQIANLLLRLTSFREFTIAAVIVAVCVGMSLYDPRLFLTRENLLNVLLSLSVESIVAIGMTILLVSGGFDLSVGSTFAMTGAVTASCMTHGVPVPLAIVIGMATGALIGLINGVFIAKIGINAFITTLAMMSIVRGILHVMMGSGSIVGLPESFKVIGQGNAFGIQFPIFIALFLVLTGDFLLRKSRFFRQSYYIGGNERAAALSGIAVNRIKIFNYALTGCLAALAGIVMTARLGSASNTAGKDLELRVITAVVIGGASLQGGEGTVFGAFLGSLLMGILISSLNMVGVDARWNMLVSGATLLIAVLIDTVSKRRRVT